MYVDRNNNVVICGEEHLYRIHLDPSELYPDSITIREIENRKLTSCYLNNIVFSPPSRMEVILCAASQKEALKRAADMFEKYLREYSTAILATIHKAFEDVKDMEEMFHVVYDSAVGGFYALKVKTLPAGCRVSEVYNAASEDSIPALGIYLYADGESTALKTARDYFKTYFTDQLNLFKNTGELPNGGGKDINE